MLCSYFKDKIKKLNNQKDYKWIYMLDAASGCIWNHNCIIDVQYGGYLPKINFEDSESKAVILKNFKSIIKKWQTKD